MTFKDLPGVAPAVTFIIERSARAVPDSVWWQMWRGMRAYGVSITVIWPMCACTVLVVMAVAVPGTWAHIGFAGGALFELLLSAVTLKYLSRASVRGRFDVWVPCRRSRLDWT